MNPQFKMRLANKGKGQFRADASTIWIYDAIASDEDEAEYFGGISPREFIDALAQTDGPVTLRINSPGGSVFGAQAMVAAMRAHGTPITAQVDSLAASAASVIASECAECVMAEGAMMMIHKAWGLAIGNSDDFSHTAALLEKIDGQIADTYARRSGGDQGDYMRMMAAETWLDASEAVALGLADRVNDENTQRPSAKWDLSAYEAAPWRAAEIDAPAPEPDPAPVPEAEAVEQDLRPIRERQLAARLAASPI